MRGETWSPERATLAEHPELAHLALLAHQLQLLVDALALVHGDDRQPEPLTHHARSMVQVVRILELQIDTYRELVGAHAATATAKRRGGRGR